MHGFRFLEVPADADGSALEGAMWCPCSEPPGEIDLGKITATFKITVHGAKNCPITGDKLPLVVFSHGKGSRLHEIDEPLDVGRSPDHHLRIGGATDIHEVIAGMPTALRPSRSQPSCGRRSMAVMVCRPRVSPPCTEACRPGTSITWCRMPGTSPS